ncbi:MAG: hypothetical protein ACOVLL_04820 [Hydrogenophaga sp.]
MGFVSSKRKKTHRKGGFSGRSRRPISKGKFEADGENGGAILAVTAQRGIQLNAIGDFFFSANLESGFATLITEYFNVRGEAANSALKRHAPAVKRGFVFRVVARDVGVKRANGGVARHDADQKRTAAHARNMDCAQGAGKVAAIFLAGGDAPFGLDGLFGGAVLAGLGIADANFYAFNGCESGGHITDVVFLAIASHPNFDMACAFFVHIGIVNGQGSTGLGVGAQKAECQCEQAREFQFV